MDTREAATYHAVLIGAVVIGTIIVYFVVSIFRLQRKHRRLSRFAVMAEITALEEERKRLAADLHDDLGPTLSAVKLKLGSLESLSEEENKIRDDAILYVDRIIDQSRIISNGLMPATLVRNGLTAAVKEFINAMSGSDDLQIELLCPPGLDIPAEMEIHMYRIIQEIIHNTIKHAAAGKLRIQISNPPGMIIISAADNGNGFNYLRMVRDNTGMGLDNFRRRAELLAADMFVDSAPGKGTRISFHIPLPQKTPAQ